VPVLEAGDAGRLATVAAVQQLQPLSVSVTITECVSYVTVSLPS